MPPRLLNKDISIFFIFLLLLICIDWYTNLILHFKAHLHFFHFQACTLHFVAFFYCVQEIIQSKNRQNSGSSYSPKNIPHFSRSENKRFLPSLLLQGFIRNFFIYCVHCSILDVFLSVIVCDLFLLRIKTLTPSRFARHEHIEHRIDTVLKSDVLYQWSAIYPNVCSILIPRKLELQFPSPELSSHSFSFRWRI